MLEKKHNLIYQITNLVNGKIYIGRHSTNKINDNYFGSGNEIKKAIKEHGRSNFKKEILFDFATVDEMIKKELELLTEDFVQREDNYNIFDNTGGKGMLGKTHGDNFKKKLREANTGFLTVKDKDGNTFRISKNDPRYLSGELKHNLHGMIKVKDLEGNVFCVKNDDPRWLSGELVSSNLGSKRPEETTKKHIEFMKEYWSENKHSEQAIQKMRDANLKKVNVRDKDGNEFRVSTDDPRIESGELVNATKGKIWIYNVALEKSTMIYPEKLEEFKRENWKEGKIDFKFKTIWITNQELRRNDQIPPKQIEKYLKDGWSLGKIYYPKKKQNSTINK